MSQRPRIIIAQHQRLALSSSLHTSIRLLRSDTAGLTRYLEEQAAENPHMRLIPPEPPKLGDWLPRWTGVLTYGNRAPLSDQAVAAQPSMIAHVVAAIQAMNMTRSAQRIALALVEILEPSGWLSRRFDSIAADLGLPQDEVLAVLSKLQRIEPAGLFARNLAECLMLQAKELGVLDDKMMVMLRHLDALASGNTQKLARLCGCTEDEIVRRFRIIRTMNPKPGAEFGGAEPVHGREPDLLARALKGGRWQVTLNKSALPSVDVIDTPHVPGLASMDRQKGGSNQGLAKAKALRYVLRARNETLLKVGKEIALRQVSALVQGRAALQPMTMAEVAQSLELHVSTISRVVAGATIDTPHGLWTLRQLFSGARGTKPAKGAGTPAADAPRMAAAALRHRIGRIIAAERPEAPLSDAALGMALADETGVVLARRTIAQYREAEGIPPAHRRRKRASPAKASNSARTAVNSASESLDAAPESPY